MKQNKRKQIIQAIKTKYQCNLTAEDIINKTDFFDNKFPIKKDKICCYKYAFLTSIFILVLIITSFTMITITNIKNDVPIYIDRYIHIKDDKDVLKEEYIEQMNNLCEKINQSPTYFIQLDGNTSMYVYSGYNFIETGINYRYYFYVIECVSTGLDAYIKIDDKKIIIDKESIFGILKQIPLTDVGNNQLLTIVFGKGNNEKTYAFSY